MFDLLRQIEERNFGPLDTLDQGDDIPDSDLLNGFLEGFNQEDESPVVNHQKIYQFIICICVIILSFTTYHMLMIIK